MKKISLGVIVVLVILIGGHVFYQLQKDDNQFAQEKINTKYYQNLKDKCVESEFKECCLSSVKTMETMKAYKFGDFMIDGCKDNYDIVKLRCPGAYVLCKPSTVKETNKADFQVF